MVLHQTCRYCYRSFFRSSLVLTGILVFVDGAFGMVEDNNSSLLATIGGAICWIFAPLGFGDWQSTVATITGLIAKENVVSTFGVLFGGFSEVAENGDEVWGQVALHYTQFNRLQLHGI